MRIKTRVKVFDDYDDNSIDRMNSFIADKDIIDIKMNTVVAVTGKFFTRYLVVYEVKDMGVLK